MIYGIDSIKEVLFPVFEKYRDRVIFAYLFGSAARGDIGPLSDIDIAVFLSPGPGESYQEMKLSLHADLCRALKTNEVDVLVLNGATNIIILDEIVRQGRVVCDMNPELREEFELNILHGAIDFREQRFAVMGV